MNKWLRKEKAVVCPIHKMVQAEASNRLAHSGDFSKEEILEALNLEAIEEAIRWDYIREFLETDHGCELLPVSAAYFKRHQKRDEQINPSRYIATGHGKKTAGFAAIIAKNEHLIVERVKQRKKVANGVAEALRKYVDAINKKLDQPALENNNKMADHSDNAVAT